MAEEQTQLLVNGLWKYHLATRKYYFSPEICEIFNLDIQDLKSHDVFLERIHPDDRAYYSTTFEERLGKQQHFTLAYRIVLEHGTVKDIEEDVEILRDEGGRAISYAGIISDITSYTTLEKENRKTYSFIDSILKTLPNQVFVKEIDAGFRFTLVNDAFAAFYGLTPADIVGKSDKDILTPDQAKECLATDTVACKCDITAPLVSVENIPVTGQGIKYMQTVKFAHVINGTNYLICSAMDITDLVDARHQAEKSDKLKSAFLCTISHEVRTPMNSIMGYSQLIGETKDSKELGFFCEKIEESSKQLLDLISNIVYLSKLETDHKDFVCEPVDMELLFATIRYQYVKHVEGKKLNFIYNPHHPSCTVYSSIDGITELLRNFLDNAIKFTEHGSISMGYDVITDKSLRIWVRDTGMGIDKRDIKQIFKRFVKLNDFAPGTGIGFSIAKKIAKTLKGKIGIESQLGSGTYIWAELPI